MFEYKQQQYRLLVFLAKAYVNRFMYRTCLEEMGKHSKKFLLGDHTLAQWIHVLTSGFKAWAADSASEGAEVARRSCGGQGYVNMSGLPGIVTTLAGGVTFEGENQVLYQQIFRYLMKQITNIEKSRPILDRVQYLKNDYHKYCNIGSNMNPSSARGRDFLDKVQQISIFRHRALRLIYSTRSRLIKSSKLLGEAGAWNDCMMEIIDAGKAHVEYEIAVLAHQHVDSLSDQYKSLEPVLRRLVSVSALSTIIRGDSFVADSHINLSQMHDIQECIDELLRELYPNAVALTDAWDFSDACLSSAIGCKDGNAYERLLVWTRQMPINELAKKSVGVYTNGWKNSVKPVLRAKL
jgi:acyl-CoA oxidase